jgi:hypothetical protein
MELRDLVLAVLGGDLLSARQWVADAQRGGVKWESLQRPQDFTSREMTVAAALAELLAVRAGEKPPPWTDTVDGSAELVVLDPGLDAMPRSFARAKALAPEPLRKRNLVALPEFLLVA